MRREMAQYVQEEDHGKAIAVGLELVSLTANSYESSNSYIGESMLLLGNAYSAAGQYAEASDWLRKALAHAQRYEEDDASGSGVVYAAIASNYLHSGQLEKGALYLSEALKVLEAAGPGFEMDLAKAYKERAWLRFNQGNFDEAEEDYKKVMAIEERQLGLQSPALARSLVNLGGVYMQQGNYAKANAVYSHALNMQRATLGPDDAELATTWVNMAVYHDQMGDFGEAEKYLHKALDLRQRKLDPTHPLIGAVVDDLINLYLSLGRQEEALSVLDSLKADRIRNFGGDHPAVAEVLDKYASLALAQNDAKVAERYMEDALAIRQNAYGLSHDRVAASLYSLGKLQNMLGKHEQARITLTRGLDIYENQATANQEAMSALLAELVVADLAQGQDALVEEHLLLLVGVKEAALGSSHPELAEALGQLYLFYSQSGDAEKAEAIRSRLAQF